MGVGDVWVVVGWLSDIILYLKCVLNINVFVLELGISLWVDLWVR